jgi:nucleoside-diphosphate-sugar epimerase
VRILVTGAGGRLGKAVVDELLGRGWEVGAVDRAVPADHRPEVGWRQVELGDVGQVAGAMAGCQGVVHLGAIPVPYRHPDEFVFANNTQATFAVLQAASLLELRRIVIASSISALGPSWSPTPSTPLYAPVDEWHPLRPADAYGLSKQVDEQTAAMVQRRTGISVAALRFAWIATAEEATGMAARLAQHPAEATRTLWSYVDIRDAAAACRLALEAEIGFEAFNVIASDSLSETPTEELIRRHAPDTEIRRPIQGTDSAYSIDKARRLLDYEPRYSWRRPG